ncbi:MAG: type IV conjugative transfer system coupling protein TraD [Cardiobacteriaceae bacterium]|nr:type IV conjugative transfer system coupling protein TraD [Cardiobacteriaceae bacterium]
MIQNHEVLLRDIYEYIPATAYVMAAALLIIASEFAFAIPTVAFTLSGLFLLRAAVLFRRGYRVKRYQKNLTRLPMYRMRSKDIPISNKVHFLGMGFEWTSVHAQRSYDLSLYENSKYKKLPKSYLWIRDLELKLEHNKKMQWLVRFTSSTCRQEHWLWFLNPWKPAPPLEGQPWIHAIGLYEPEKKILQDLSNRVGHTMVIGTTRVGKTRLAELIISQDIARGDVVIVIDPKGDADLMLRCYSEAVRAGREDKFYLFHLGYPDISAQYNPIGSFLRITEVASRIAGQMPSEGQSAAFKEFVWGYVNQVAKGLVGIGKTPDYPLIKKYSQHLEPLYIEFMDLLLADKILNYESQVERYINILQMEARERRAQGITDDLSKISRDRDAVARYLLYKHHIGKIILTASELDTAQSLTKAFITDQAYLSKLIASLDPFLEKMTSGAVADLISPRYLDPKKPVFDWGSIIQSGGIVYVGLDALSDQEVARTVGASMLADLTSQYGRIYKEGRNHGLPDIGVATKDLPIRIHIDEANEPADKTLIPSLNKAGGAGVSVTAYTQSTSDFEARLGNKAFANQMLANFNTTIFFRIQETTTAKIFTEKQRKSTVRSLLTFSSSSYSSDISSNVDFTSSTQSRMSERDVETISVTDFTELPKGQFFMMKDGNKLYKGRVPLLIPERSNIPDNIRDAADKMAQQYNSTVPNWYNYQEKFNPADALADGEDSMNISQIQEWLDADDDLNFHADSDDVMDLDGGDD